MYEPWTLYHRILCEKRIPPEFIRWKEKCGRKRKRTVRKGFQDKHKETEGEVYESGTVLNTPSPPIM